MTIDRRIDRRIPVGPDHAVRFTLQGRPFRHVRITNVSQGGCFATLAGAEPELLAPGHLLEAFAFEHPDLPPTPFTARITFCLSSDEMEDALDYSGLGIQFLAPPRDVADRLAHLLADHV